MGGANLARYRRGPSSIKDAYAILVQGCGDSPPIRSSEDFGQLVDQLQDAHPLRWSGDDDSDENRGAWDTAFQAMHETGWALDEGIDDPEVVQAYMRGLRG